MALLCGLADKGFGRDPLAKMEKAIDAADSDMCDVMAYVAFASVSFAFSRPHRTGEYRSVKRGRRAPLVAGEQKVFGAVFTAGPGVVNLVCYALYHCLRQ